MDSWHRIFFKIIFVIPKPIANKIRPVFFDILKKLKFDGGYCTVLLRYTEQFKSVIDSIFYFNIPNIFYYRTTCSSLVRELSPPLA
jgi:hypothetical protein